MRSAHKFRFHSAFLKARSDRRRRFVCSVAFAVAIFRQVPKPRFLTVVSVRADIADSGAAELSSSQAGSPRQNVRSLDRPPDGCVDSDASCTERNSIHRNVF